ncbi:MAG: response regulator [Burkholderiales bacterium]|nr:response regulator [Burkholderiales bacterium]
MENKRKLFLVIEDDYASSKLLHNYLNYGSFDSIIVSSEIQVWDILEKKEISIILVDEEYTQNKLFLEKIIQHPKTQNISILIIGVDYELQKITLVKEIDYFMQNEESFKDYINMEDLHCKLESIFNSGKEIGNILENIHVTEKKSQKILLAEDYKHSQLILVRLLKNMGLENVIVAENGEEALKLAALNHFDLMLIDMQMPIMNGFEATKKIRLLDKYKETPIIALTAFAMRGDREKCIEAGATDYLAKPIDSNDFKVKLNYYLDLLTSQKGILVEDRSTIKKELIVLNFKNSFCRAEAHA